ncbi:DUF5125 domain-containing protein [Geofilum sp. OHC36d9]|uniref:DUF5125 domain-containing protein n=1 Tax=Geofilum sp. OHC36d9 TaxID=3458413 RepID=UPI0040347567
MKKQIFLFIAILSLTLFSACSDEDETTGQPQLTVSGIPDNAFFGDSIAFSASVMDEEGIPLSTLKARLYFGEEMVSETVIRTKNEGEYAGKIFVPFMKNIPDGTASLKFVIQNIKFATKEQVFDLPLQRPNFAYLQLVSEDQEYQMEKIGDYTYGVTAEFPQKIKAVIKAPAFGERGNDIVFGWSEGIITQSSETTIPFSNSVAGNYTISFNTLNYEAAPFITLKFAGTEMAMIDDNNYKIEQELTQGQIINIEGFGDTENWWIDTDYLQKNEDGTFTFLPISGKYRVTANFEYQYFIFEVMSGDDTATLQDDGTGALWIIGENIGKPSLDNTTGWDTNKALCLAPIAEKVYQITVVGGETIDLTSINFKFFHQKNWGGEYTNAELTTESDLVFIGDGTNGRDSGNLGIVDGKTFESNKTYVFTVDISAGKTNAVLTVTAL